MPTFDFQCKQCGHTFEFTRPFASRSRPSCPACSSKRVEKLIAPPAVHFKGAGWYKNDSKKSSAPAKMTKPEEKKPDTTSTDPTPTETKAPETKSQKKE